MRRQGANGGANGASIADADRKERIEAACRVGAAFVRRRVLQRWRHAAIASRHSIRSAREGDPHLDGVSAGRGNSVEGSSDGRDDGDSSEDTDEGDEAETIEYLADDSDDDFAASEQTLAATAWAFTAWQQWTQAVGFREARLVSRVWRSWLERTLQGRHEERMRRRAVRFAYLRALGRALARLRVLVATRHNQCVLVSLHAWKAYASLCRTKRQRGLAAEQHAERRLMRRVLTLGFGGYATSKGAKRLALQRVDAFQRQRALTTAFAGWRSVCESERRHDLELRRLLEQWRASPSTRRRRDDSLRVLVTCWVDYAHSKSVARLVVANFRGRAHLRMLRECLAHWVSLVSRIRWRQIRNERARTHLRRATLRKRLVQWRERAAAARNARNQTRAALVHWKLAVEKRVFAKWTAYIGQKHVKRQRIHDALQFRHLQLVTHGVRHWVTAAMHMQEVRERHSTRVQAAHTERVWRRVASIARHWKLLAGRRRRERRGDSTDATWTRSGMPRAEQSEDVEWLVRPQHQRLLPVDSRAGAYPGRGLDYSLETPASPLSGFVMLPRTRPQPRKSVEMLLLSEQQSRAEEAMHQSNFVKTEETKRVVDGFTDVSAAMTRPRELARYGFQFPVDKSAPASRTESRSDSQVRVVSRAQRGQAESWRREQQATEALRGEYAGTRAVRAATTPPVSTFETTSKKISDKYGTLLDALEQQLLRLQTRKHEWREFQQRLASLRASHSSTDEDRQQQQQFEARVLDMEREYQVRHRDWREAQQRLRVVAAELAQLRQVLQPQVSS